MEILRRWCAKVRPSAACRALTIAVIIASAERTLSTPDLPAPRSVLSDKCDYRTVWIVVAMPPGIEVLMVRGLVGACRQISVLEHAAWPPSTDQRLLPFFRLQCNELAGRRLQDVCKSHFNGAEPREQIVAP